VFVSKGLSLLLLLLTALTMGGFAYKWVTQGGATARVKLASGMGPLNPDYVVTTLFVSNFIGIVFARTLHYQVSTLSLHRAIYMYYTYT
jgi:alpha-1,3-mannosyltransferase